MVTMVDMIREIKDSIEEMTEKLKELSAKELMVQRELDNIKTEKDYIQENIPLYRGILEDLTKRRDGEIQVKMKGEIKPIKKIGATIPKKLVAIDEHNEEIAAYDSIGKAAKDLKLAQPTVSYRIKIPVDKQIQKFGFALKIAG